MTREREEAIKGLKRLSHAFSGYKPNEEMFDMAIKALEEEPCEDAIRRADALDLFGHGAHSWTEQEIQERLEALPSVLPGQNMGEWIPVSKKLPEANESVLVYDGVDVFVAWRWITYRNQEWDSRDDAFDRDTPIIAWMPLPEPYKAYKVESEDKECIED